MTDIVKWGIEDIKRTGKVRVEERGLTSMVRDARITCEEHGFFEVRVGKRWVRAHIDPTTGHVFRKN